jgi:hypothetical protein
MKRHMREALMAVIAEQLIHTLGEPNSLHNVQVRRIWKDHYRVNVLIGHDLASARIADSFFVVVDRYGNIIDSDPKITKQY